MQSIILTLSSFIIGFGGQSYAFLFFMPGRKNYPLEVAVYGVLQPILSVLPWATLICLYFVTGFGRTYQFLGSCSTSTFKLSRLLVTLLLHLHFLDQIIDFSQHFNRTVL